MTAKVGAHWHTPVAAPEQWPSWLTRKMWARDDGRRRATSSLSHGTKVICLTRMTIDWSHFVSEFPGKWIALAEDEVTLLSVADTAKEALTFAQSQSRKFQLYQVPGALDDITHLEVHE